MSMKKILCLDFDGVIHSYTSGWKGARTIPDPPIPGALEFLVRALEHFQVAILSSRSHQLGGRYAMKRWLRKHLIEAGQDCAATPEWWQRQMSKTAFADPWDDEVAYATSKIIKQIQWPKHKPPATLSIDDRAMRFSGVWPSFEAIQKFKPYKHDMRLKTIHGGDIP